MPLGKGVRYRVTTRGGKKVRLAFRGNEVIETKNLETGAMHTKEEFERDKKRKQKRSKKRRNR